MKSNPVVLLGIALLAGVFAAAPVRADNAAPANCEVPAYLLTTASALPKVEDAINHRRLDILVVGSRSSTIVTSEASAYPGRLQATLKDLLPKVAVSVSVELQIKKTAEEVATGLVKLVEVKKPTLVIWQTGTYDAMRSIDPDDFRSAVGDGIAALQKVGADVVLIQARFGGLRGDSDWASPNSSSNAACRSRLESNGRRPVSNS